MKTPVQGVRIPSTRPSSPRVRVLGHSTTDANLSCISKIHNVIWVLRQKKVLVGPGIHAGDTSTIHGHPPLVANAGATYIDDGSTIAPSLKQCFTMLCHLHKAEALTVSNSKGIVIGINLVHGVMCILVPTRGVLQIN
eukprot:scaffold2860_cov491-Pavlova_lutheri.AAC.1